MLAEHRGIHVPDDWLRDVAGVHRTTVARWRAEQRLPRAVSLLVRVMHHGELELVHELWRDYRLDRRTGTLWTPSGWPCAPADVLAIQYRAAHVRALEAELASRRLAASLAAETCRCFRDPCSRPGPLPVPSPRLERPSRALLDELVARDVYPARF
jgi:hypothetical protein